MTKPSQAVSAILDAISSARIALNKNEPGSRESLIDHSRALIATLEIPSEFIQRTFWAEPAQSAIIRLAVDVKLFQHLQEAANASLSLSSLSQKTGVDATLLSSLARHLVAMKLITFDNGAFHATKMSNDLAADNFQHGICYCYDVVRPSVNAFPAFLKRIKYKSPSTDGTDVPFHDGHKTQLPFFEWLVATPPHLHQFDSFMSAYRAGKPNWYDFYPVSERIIEGFDSSTSDVLLVDVGGGRGHDAASFAAQYTSHPGKIVMQDREPVIASLLAQGSSQCFQAEVHNFFTPQPIKGARVYYLHSILHDWGDADSVKILESLVPALKKGYSRVLLNEIVVNEEEPTLAATSMDLMMLAHFGVRERTEAELGSLLTKAKLRLVKAFSFPGVAESLIEAELA
ncbi:O-methyltransferase [Penicillium frequentans]|uniref:O-methyltransferase n=1 Tax=Penicillium frequentans TaxID=3151616 RepID=A0AAD6GK89_9EURO|nr:O-methyltransferase [Penicillium glabrum]